MSLSHPASQGAEREERAKEKTLMSHTLNDFNKPFLLAHIHQVLMNSGKGIGCKCRGQNERSKERDGWRRPRVVVDE